MISPRAPIVAKHNIDVDKDDRGAGPRRSRKQQVGRLEQRSSAGVLSRRLGAVAATDIDVDVNATVPPWPGHCGAGSSTR